MSSKTNLTSIIILLIIIIVFMIPITIASIGQIISLLEEDQNDAPYEDQMAPRQKTELISIEDAKKQGMIKMKKIS